MRASALLLATALGAAPVAAADLPSRGKPAPVLAAAPFSWNGLYVGATLGGVWHQTEFASPDLPPVMTSGDPTTARGAGVLGGATIGYNLQFGAFVAGLEADYSFANARAERGVFDPDYSGQARLTSIGTARARFGVAMDRALVYATGGFAFARLSSYVDDSNSGGYGYSSKRNANGWTLGGGVEYAIAGNLSVKAEGLYYDLGKKRFDDRLSDAWSYREGNSGVIARVGLNYRFGGPALPTANRF